MTLEPHFLSREQLDRKALQTLRGYNGGKHLHTPSAVDIEDLAELHLGISIDYQALSSDGNILGMSIFYDTTMNVYTDAGTESAFFPGKSILLDTMAYQECPETRQRFTLAHECAHMILHRRYFYRSPAMSLNTQTPYRPYMMSQKRPGDKFDRCEWQADYLGAALLMPKESFGCAYGDVTPGVWNELTSPQKMEVVSQLATIFHVSREAAAYRIRDLKLAI